MSSQKCHESGCGCEKQDKPNYLLTGAGIVLLAAAIIIRQPWISLALYICAYALVGYRAVWSAIKNIGRGKVFDENFLMTIATIGAFAIGEYSEAIAVMLFYQAGEYLQDYAVERSKKSITSLLELKPESAILKSGESVPAEKVKKGEVIIVRPGDRVPLDGTVVSGVSTIDNSAITGEFMPVDVLEGNSVYSGSINLSGVLEIVVEKVLSESTISKILEMVQNAENKKAKTQTFMTRFAKVYTPIVCGLALLVAIVPVLFGEPFQKWLYNALIFLVVSCPCALVISIPLGFFGGIGGASRMGILFKGGSDLETLAKVDAIALDKTGTLTTGVMKVISVKANNIAERELLRIAAHAESFSSHPIAQAIENAFGGSIEEQMKDYEYIPGRGVKANIGGQNVLAGNYKMMNEYGISAVKYDSYGTVVYIAIGNAFAGCIEIGDTIKPEARGAISELMNLGVKNISMLTGDGDAPAQEIARQIGIQHVYSQLLPDQKAEHVERISKQGYSVAFAGDGINDSPVLALADIGIAMGAMGSDAAIEAADVVILNDNISMIPAAIKIARKTKRVVAQNIALALGIKAFVLVLGTIGMASMWEAVIADVGVALLATLNSMRMMNHTAIKRIDK